MSGTSNIYSLRDAKGQPHVTIETASEPGITTPITADMRAARGYIRPHDKYINFDTGLTSDVLVHPTPKIVQIKGKGNAKPAEQYLPFVQDFIRSGNWSGIGDAPHTGLTPEELQQLLKGQ